MYDLFYQQFRTDLFYIFTFKQTRISNMYTEKRTLNLITKS